MARHHSERALHVLHIRLASPLRVALELHSTRARSVPEVGGWHRASLSCTGSMHAARLCSSARTAHDPMG